MCTFHFHCSNEHVPNLLITTQRNSFLQFIYFYLQIHNNIIIDSSISYFLQIMTLLQTVTKVVT